MKAESVNIKEWRLEIFRLVKPVFKEYLGQYTHQKISEDWHFRALAFVREEMTYVFGFNLGFFKREDSNLAYSHVGMNVLVRTNGINPDLRAKYRNFFETNLKEWINLPKGIYTSFRGGVGVELPRMRKIESFKNEQQIVDFLSQSIKELSRTVYPKIAENPDKIFDAVVRGAPLWNQSIVEMAKERLDILK